MVYQAMTLRGLGAHLQWLGPQSLLQYSPSQSGFWPCTGVGPPGDWEPPALLWYSVWIWEKPCQSEEGVGSEGQPFISDSHSTFQQGADSEQRGFTR